jgi:hypothetical protein
MVSFLENGATTIINGVATVLRELNRYNINHRTNKRVAVVNVDNTITYTHNGTSTITDSIVYWSK